jgi:hypothetical protein
MLKDETYVKNIFKDKKKEDGTGNQNEGRRYRYERDKETRVGFEFRRAF